MVYIKAYLVYFCFIGSSYDEGKSSAPVISRGWATGPSRCISSTMLRLVIEGDVGNICIIVDELWLVNGTL